MRIRILKNDSINWQAAFLSNGLQCLFLAVGSKTSPASVLQEQAREDTAADDKNEEFWQETLAFLKTAASSGSALSSSSLGIIGACRLSSWAFLNA